MSNADVDGAVPSAGQIAELEARIVRAVAACVQDLMDDAWHDREWVHLFVDMEVDGGGRSSSISFSLCHRPGQPIEKASFRLSPEAKQLFAQLADAVEAATGRRWASTQLRLERSGRYSLTHSYDVPYRLGGQLNDTRFSDYLAQWLASDDGAPWRPAPRGWWQKVLGK